MIDIRRATDADWSSLWPIFKAVVAKGDSFLYPPDTTAEEAFGIWMSPAVTTYFEVDRQDADGEGVFVGNGVMDGQTHAFLLTVAAPEPGSACLLLADILPLALTILSRCRRRPGGA
jgi:hypothetical protein